MLQAYKAVLRGNQLEWQDSAPDGLTSNEAMPVIITLLEQPPFESERPAVGPKMAALVEQRTSSGDIADHQAPIAWEHILREV